MITDLYKRVIPVSLRKYMKEIRFQTRVFFDQFLFNDRYPYRKYNDKYKTIFIHIPKNAGTSVLMLLNDGNRIPQEHNIYWDYMKADYRRFHKYKKFAIIRNPWDRLYSAYSYLKQGGNRGTDLEFCDQMNREVSDFRQFICDWLDCDKIYQVKVLNPQYLYLYDLYDNCQIDRIIRYESLEQDLASLLSELKIDEKLPHINKSEHDDYITMYDDEMIEIVKNYYRKDIELFDYSFQGKA